ncbi:MAG: polyphosphate kinase 1 [Salinivirgaceae bacterium]|nr:polyphosphate kinase 1 [Salinivirgaceae bacterium]
MGNLPMKYFDRELSWLSFNARVLQEASDKSNPLNERIKFLGIYSNNQDEFFRVRIASLYRMIELNKKNFGDDVEKLQLSLSEAMQEVRNQQIAFTTIHDELIEDLKKKQIFLIDETQLDQEQGEFVRSYFREKVRHHLFPIMLRNITSAGFLTDHSIYLAIMLGRSDKPEINTYSIIEIPTNAVNRFLILPEKAGKKFIILLDDVIRFCLDEIFVRFKYNSFSAYTFKFTRDAELDMDNDVSKSFIELMSESLAQRKKGSALRFVYDRNMPKELLEGVTQKLKFTSKDHMVEGGRYHNFKDYMGFPNLGGPELENHKIIPLPHKDIPEGGSILHAIRQKDIMLHYPYQSFQYIVDLLREASIDSKVRSIKMTIYRLANPSNVINALINAARNGKRVTVFMELQARFDEEANIYWSQQLQGAGVRVLRNIPGLKVHCKLILIKRKETTGYRHYANIGTGNFHEKTAGIYCDSTLLTANPDITLDVDKVFDLFEASYRPMRFKTLIVSPFSTRNFFIKLINNEIRNALLGKDAWMIIKINSLADIPLINRLYAASQAGVKIQLIVRGICKLIPGVPGMSENITVRSIVDKFLEHSRVLIFCNGGDESYYISSADWMVRNLDNRIEVTTPIFDPEIQQVLKAMMNIQLEDNCKARIIDTTMSNTYYRDTKEHVRAQEAIYHYLKSIH